MQVPDVRKRHADDDEVEDHIGHRTAEVNVACLNAFSVCDGDVPGGLYGVAVEDYAA